MSHLPTDRLQELGWAEGAPASQAERTHLADCGSCSRELSAFSALGRMASAETAIAGMPLTRWDTLAAELRREGMIAAPVAPSAPALGSRLSDLGGTGRGVGARRWMRAAAAIVLVVGGAVAGRVSASMPSLGGAAVAQAPAPANDEPAAPVAGETPVRDVANLSDVDALLPNYQSTEEARVALQRFEVAYQHAAAFLAEHDTTARAQGAEAYRTRLAALDQVMATTRQAMSDAPYDPVINGYYLTTISQREATLRQLNGSLPAGVRLTRF